MYIIPIKFFGALNIGFKNIIIFLIQASISWVSTISRILPGHPQASSLAASSPDKVQT